MSEASIQARRARAELVAAIQGITTLIGELDDDALEVGLERYCYVIDTLDDVVSGLGAVRASVDEIAGVSATPTAEDELAQLRRDVEDAENALGLAWFRGGASLAEAIRRKTRWLEDLIPVCDAAPTARGDLQ